MKITIEVQYRNSDSGDTHEESISVNTSNQEIEDLVITCKHDPSTDSFTNLFKRIYDNPTMDGAEKGLLYDELWPVLSRCAFDDLGWHDVTVEILGVLVEDESIGFDLDQIDNSLFALQLSRDGFMYCYN